jgi:hypothetical protein
MGKNDDGFSLDDMMEIFGDTGVAPAPTKPVATATPPPPPAPAPARSAATQAELDADELAILAAYEKSKKEQKAREEEARRKKEDEQRRILEDFERQRMETEAKEAKERAEREAKRRQEIEELKKKKGYLAQAIDACLEEGPSKKRDTMRTTADGKIIDDSKLYEIFYGYCFAEREDVGLPGDVVHPNYNAGLHWVIVGGESGAGARPCRVEWIRSVVRQCRAAGVPVFVKQLGANVEGDPLTPPVRDEATGMTRYTVQQVIEITDRKGGDPAEWPEDLRVREMPVAPTGGEGGQ